MSDSPLAAGSLAAGRIARLVSRNDALAIELGEAAIPQPGPREVLLRIGAASLNYRDLLIKRGLLGRPREGLTPLSDGAGRVAAVGEGVTRWKPGDRATPLFFRDWTGGPYRPSYASSALGGGETDGVLSQFIVMPEDSLVLAPAALTDEEVATLPCAALTAWHALMVRGGLKAGDGVLVQGTGGVALFGLQFAVAAGARAIVISSSDEKLERARRLGAWGAINYRSTPEWDVEARRLTDGEGVTHVLELGGAGTFERSMNALAPGGKIALIGVLTGFGGYPNLRPLMTVNADVNGVYVGSGEHFVAMNAFIARHGIRPVIDKAFALDDVAEAYERLASSQHFGKVVIRL